MSLCQQSATGERGRKEAGKVEDKKRIILLTNDTNIFRSILVNAHLLSWSKSLGWFYWGHGNNDVTRTIFAGYQPISPVSPPCSLSQNNSDNESNFRSPFITSVMPDKIIYNTQPNSRDDTKRGMASLLDLGNFIFNKFHLPYRVFQGRQIFLLKKASTASPSPNKYWWCFPLTSIFHFKMFNQEQSSPLIPPTASTNLPSQYDSVMKSVKKSWILSHW